METWKDIIGYEGLYRISNLGKILNVKIGKLRKVNYCNDYPLILLRKKAEKQKMFKMHLLVAAHFVRNPFNKPQVNHKNGNKLDFRASNLEWVTPKENVQHAVENGLRCHVGDMNPMSATSTKRREEIIEQKSKGISTVSISKKYGVSRETVCRIYRRHLRKAS